MMWQDAVAEVLQRVRSIKTGGKALKAALFKEVRALQLLRFQTFCKYVPAK